MAGRKWRFENHTVNLQEFFFRTNNYWLQLPFAHQSTQSKFRSGQARQPVTYPTAAIAPVPSSVFKATSSSDVPSRVNYRESQT